MQKKYLIAKHNKATKDTVEVPLKISKSLHDEIKLKTEGGRPSVYDALLKIGLKVLELNDSTIYYEKLDHFIENVVTPIYEQNALKNE